MAVQRSHPLWFTKAQHQAARADHAQQSKPVLVEKIENCCKICAATLF
jgi:hypothetical protein